MPRARLGGAVKPRSRVGGAPKAQGFTAPLQTEPSLVVPSDPLAHPSSCLACTTPHGLADRLSLPASAAPSSAPKTILCAISLRQTFRRR